MRCRPIGLQCLASRGFFHEFFRAFSQAGRSPRKGHVLRRLQSRPFRLGAGELVEELRSRCFIITVHQVIFLRCSR